jgi:site-specific DNA-methyltransferase (adenine-specific)
VRPYYEEAGITIFNADCEELLPDLRANAVITDPPYGVGRIYGELYNDRRHDYWEWIAECVRLMRLAAPVVAITHRQEAIRRLPDWDWVACWHKPYGAGARIGNSPILPHWEPILLWGIHTLGTRRPALADVITVNPERSPLPTGRIANGHIVSRAARAATDADTTEHPLPKPIRLMERLILALTLEDEMVCDAFCGSGTTLVAAKNLNRRAIGIEIEEKYCEIAAKRLSQGVFNFGQSK